VRRHTVQGAVGPLSCLCWDRDGSRTPVVFVHGINGAGEQWLPLAGHIADRRVVAVDLRGHGDSAAGGCYGAADYAADISAAMSALGIGCAHLVGASFGASVCVTLAATEPQRAASLTLLGGALCIDTDADAAVAQLHTLGAESFFTHAAATAFGPNADDAMRHESVRLAARRDETVIAQVLRAALCADVSAAAARVAAPARVLTGELDHTCAPALGAQLAAALHTDLTVLPGLGHMAHLEDPARVAALLTEHIGVVESSGAAVTMRGV
jgi:pimeloyl-ACP methyl ester carboxylesterase